MKLEFVPVKGQKFEIGRTINPFNCTCEKCDFMNCPKNNYAVKMVKKLYKVEDFWDEFREDILSLNKPEKYQYRFPNTYHLELSYKLITESIDMIFRFPKGTYWSPTDDKWHTEDTDIEDRIYSRIELQKVSRSGNIVTLGTINIADGKASDYDLSEAQEKLATRISDTLKELKKLICEHYLEQDKDWKIGWLSPEGRHYPCRNTQHSKLAELIGHGEISLERDGWVKIMLENEEYGYLGYSRLMTAEQRNWLSMNGYILED